MNMIIKRFYNLVFFIHTNFTNFFWKNTINLTFTIAVLCNIALTYYLFDLSFLYLFKFDNYYYLEYSDN